MGVITCTPPRQNLRVVGAGERTASYCAALSMISCVIDGVKKVRVELGLGCGTS